MLGGFEMWSHSGAPIQLPPKKARALLAYLALCESRPQARDKLAALLWEDSSEHQEDQTKLLYCFSWCRL
ncbi:MAG TPA: hypothetical protein VMP00_09475 [Burkholderiales bacterium]|nr:hypothetical protein [Burkholderiales bacterium]